jgi:hypothetical protein
VARRSAQESLERHAECLGCINCSLALYIVTDSDSETGIFYVCVNILAEGAHEPTYLMASEQRNDYLT